MGSIRKQLVVLVALLLAGIALVGFNVAKGAPEDGDVLTDGILDPFSLQVLELQGLSLSDSRPSMVRIPFRPTLRSPFRPPLQ